MLLNPCLAVQRLWKWYQQRPPGGEGGKGNEGLFALGDGVYLFLSHGLQLFRLALPVVFHDHHGGVDFAHCQVCGCWKNDKLPCKIRPGWDGTLSRGGGEWGDERQIETKTTDTEKFTIRCWIHQWLRTILFHVSPWRNRPEPPKQEFKLSILDLVGSHVHPQLVKAGSLTMFGQWWPIIMSNKL